MAAGLLGNPNVQTAILGLLIACFGAWAFVVWDGTKQVTRHQTEIMLNLAAIQGKLGKLESQFESVNAGWNSHRRERWHPNAGEKLSEFGATLSSIKRDLEELKREQR